VTACRSAWDPAPRTPGRPPPCSASWPAPPGWSSCSPQQAGEQRITDLAAQLGGTQANISAHLTRLKQAGLITSRTQGRAVYYRLTQPELGALLQTAGQLLTPAGQQATEENDTTVRKTQPTKR
jgi:DNA-binding transcriptional ArsR family regulator